MVIHYPVFGGPHNQALRLLAPLSKRGWETVVLLPDEPGNARTRLEDGGVPVVTTKMDRLRAKPSLRLQWRFVTGLVPAVRRIRAVIRAEKINAVMIGGLVNPHAAIAARLEGVPVVWQLLDTRTPRIVVRVMTPIVKRLADAILVTGREVARLHSGIEDLDSRLFTFFPPVDVEEFKPAPARRASARADLEIEDSSLVVGNVSNVNPQKDQLTFVRAAGLLNKRNRELKFVILGATYPEHSGYLDRLHREAEIVGLRVGTDLVFRDPGAEVARFASALDLFLLTSEPRSEGIPTVVEEAMSLGIPVVTTDVGAVREAVIDGKTGFVVPARDHAAIADATQRLIDDNPLRQQFSANARARAEAEFDAEICANVHVKALEAAVRHAGSR